MGGEARGVFCWWCMGGSDVPIDHTAEYDSFCTCTDISHYLYLYSTDPVNWQESILFCTFHHKNRDNQIYDEWVSELPY